MSISPLHIRFYISCWGVTLSPRDSGGDSSSVAKLLVGKFRKTDKKNGKLILLREKAKQFPMGGISLVLILIFPHVTLPLPRSM